MKYIEVNPRTYDSYMPTYVKTNTDAVECTNVYTQSRSSVTEALDSIDKLKPIKWRNVSSAFPTSPWFDVECIAEYGSGSSRVSVAVGRPKVVNGVVGCSILYRVGSGNWRKATTASGTGTSNFAFCSVACNDAGLWVAGGEDDSIVAYSNDGASWTVVDYGGSDSFRYTNVATDGTDFIIAPGEMLTAEQEAEGQEWYGACDRVFKSSNGSTWTKVDLPGTEYIGTIHYANNKYIIANTWSDTWFESADGNTWTSISGLPYKDWHSLAYANGVWTGVAYDDWSKECAIFSTDNGETWQLAEMPSTGYWNSVATNGAIFLAVKSLENWAYTSTAAVSCDGEHWIQIHLNRLGNWKSVCYHDNRWIIAKGDSSMFNLAALYDVQCKNDFVSSFIYGQ